MKNVEKVMRLLTGPSVAVEFIENLLKVSAEFREDHKRYVEALAKLRSEHGTCVDEVYLAIIHQCASDLVYAGMLGLKMNLDHFANPMLPDCTWPQIDYSDYLQEDVARYRRFPPKAVSGSAGTIRRDCRIPIIPGHRRSKIGTLLWLHTGK